MSRLGWMKYDDTALAQQKRARTAIEGLRHVIGDLPSSTARTLAHEKLDEADRWIGKAIYEHQLERTSLPSIQKVQRNG